MARGSVLPRRSAVEWGIRVLVAVAATGLGVSAVSRSLAYSIRGADPERAYAMAPGDGRIAALMSEARFGDASDATHRAEATTIARQALRNEPMAVGAVATLGLNAEIEGQKKRARQWFAYSQRLSRRDLRTQLWAIEDAVARNDIPGALRHYDIALRTSRNAPDILFPVLAGAIANAPIRDELVQTLAGKPEWGQRFIEYAAAKGSAPVATATLLGNLQRRGLPVSVAARAMTINALLAAGQVDTAWNFYAAARSGVDRQRSRDPRFTANLENPSSFDWVALNDDGMTTTIEHTDKNGLFDFALSTGAGGPMLRQMQILPPGIYELVGRSENVTLPAGEGPYWSLTCNGGREIGRVDVPDSTKNAGRFGGRFTVPGGCALQYLSLVGRPSDAVGGVTGQILEVELRPAR